MDFFRVFSVVGVVVDTLQEKSFWKRPECRKRAIHYNGNDYILWCRLADKLNCLVLIVLPL